MRKTARSTFIKIVPALAIFVLLFLALVNSITTSANSTVVPTGEPKLLAQSGGSGGTGAGSYGGNVVDDEKNIVGSCSNIDKTAMQAKSNCDTARIHNMVSMDDTLTNIKHQNLSNTNELLTKSSWDKIGYCTAAGWKKRGIDCSNSLVFTCAERDRAEEIVEVNGGYDYFCNYNNPNGELAGSFLNLAMSAANKTTDGDVPVNLAYYVKDNVKRIPVLNRTAFAQGLPGSEITTISVSLALTVWKTMRDIAYGMISVVMLIIGIMIIMRRKISPQAVVTVQNAIPRVIISLFLITFSYPIGSLMASAVGVLTQLITTLVFIELGNSLGGSEIIIFQGNLITDYEALITGGLGPYAVTMFLSFVLALGVIAAVLIATFKQLFITIKMTILIIFAPLQFAWAAIPGQEEVIGKWFKEMAANVLAIPAILFFAIFGWYIFATNLTNPETIAVLASDSGGGFFNSAVVLFATPVVAMMVILMGLKADKTIKDLLGIDTRKR